MGIQTWTQTHCSSNFRIYSQALNLPEYELILLGRNISRPLPFFHAEDNEALPRMGSLRSLRDTLTATASGRSFMEPKTTRPVLGPVADTVLRLGISDRASLLVVQDSEGKN
jgi:hypothetical protein